MSGNNVVNKLPEIVSIAKELAEVLQRMPKGNSKENPALFQPSRLFFCPVDDHALLQNFMLALAMKMLSRTQMGCYFEDDEKIAEFHRQYDSMNEAMLSILNGEKGAEDRWKKDIHSMQRTIQKALIAYKEDR